MTHTENVANAAPSVEEIQKGWHELTSRVGQLEIERTALEQENKALRFLLERVIEHRQKSHGELVLLLTALVSKLPINGVGAMVAQLVEHNTHVSAVCTAFSKGKGEAALPQPKVLRELEQTKRDLAAALKTAVEELTRMDMPFESGLLQSLVEQPELFFSPKVVRANRCFIKGHVPKERIVREFGEEALIFFNDLTTDPKLNPRPKPEEIVLGFKNDFEELFQQNPALIPGKRQELLALRRRIHQSKSATDQARSQKNAFQKLSFIIDLLHYYENQGIEAPDVVFAQRLPGLVEQLVITSPGDKLDEKLIVQAEGLMEFVVSPDHRQAILNNVGKGDEAGKTLKYVLKLRAEVVPELDQVITDFVKQIIPPQNPPQPAAIATVLRLIKPEMQRLVVNGILSYDRIQKQDAEALGRAVGKELGLTGLDAPKKAPDTDTAETERHLAWGKIKELITRRNEPAVIADAFRDRLHAKYDPDEVKQSWITLIEADPISLIRIFCQLPYLADGKTDLVARAVMETYVSRLMHEKYAAAHDKVVTSLRNMFKANPNSPTLLNFLALVKWVDPESANKLSLEIGMVVPVR